MTTTSTYINYNNYTNTSTNNNIIYNKLETIKTINSITLKAIIEARTIKTTREEKAKNKIIDNFFKDLNS